MTKLLNKAADKVLGRLVPRSTARADSSWNAWCGGCTWDKQLQRYIRNFKTCHVVGGLSTCSPCNMWDLNVCN